MKITLTERKPRPTEKTLTLTISDEKKERLVEGRDKELFLSLGFGKKTELNRRKFQQLVRKVIQKARIEKISTLVFPLNELPATFLHEDTREESVSFLVQNAILANFSFSQFKSKVEKKPLKELILVGESTPEIKRGITEGKIIGTAVNYCRILANTPGGDMTPQLLSSEAQKFLDGTSVSIKILNQRQIEREEMGAILGVARGSSEEPRFIIMEYKGADDKNEQPIVFVGKGVTFDTGGLSLKPSDSMNDMHLDMSGGAAVIAALGLISKTKLKKNVIGLVPAVENMPSGSSYRPGDILKSLSGKTIEVLNTDAEGRVILADALTYAKRYNPRLVVDVATLTGAALIAFGEHAHAIMTKNEDLAEKLKDLGEISGEYVWPLPLWDEYEQYTSGTFGDVANLAVGTNSRYGGTINGGMFLYQFAKDYPKSTDWVHIDMAPRMTAAAGDYLDKGATGEPTRLLYHIAKSI